MKRMTKGCSPAFMAAREKPAMPAKSAIDSVIQRMPASGPDAREASKMRNSGAGISMLPIAGRLDAARCN